MTSFSAEEVKNIQQVWSVIRADPVAGGTNIFLSIFRKMPHVLHKFDRFKSMIPAVGPDYTLLRETPEQQAAAKVLEKHATAVFGSMSTAIDKMENIDNMKKYLLMIGANHAKIPNFKGEYFMDVEDVLIDSAKKQFGANYDPINDPMLKKLFQFTLVTLTEGFNNASIKQ